MTDLTSYALSAGVRNPRLNLFTVPPTDLSLSSNREVRINPLTTGINPVSFEVKPNSDFINLDKSFVEVELTVKKGDGNNLVAANVLVLANNLAHTLFRQISVRLNGTLISPQTDTYHLQAYVETLLNNDKQDGEDLLVPQGCYNCLDVLDDGEAGEFTANMLDTTHDDFKVLAADRKKVVLSRVKFLGGNRIVLRFTPSLEIFRLGRLLKPQMQLQMEMFFNSPNMWTIRHGGADTLRLNPEDVKVRLYIYQVRVQPSIHRELMTAMNKGKVFHYPVVRGEIRTYSHATDNRHFETDNPFNGQVPNRIVVALMKQDAFNGTATTNPFGFGKFNLSTIRLLISGEEYPYETLELDHDGSNKDLRGYHRFLQASGCHARGHRNLVGPEDWGHGKKANLYVFDTTANDSLDSPVLNPKQRGEIRLVIDFGANPGANLTVLIYGEFENILQIDGKGTVTYDAYR